MTSTEREQIARRRRLALVRHLGLATTTSPTVPPSELRALSAQPAQDAGRSAPFTEEELMDGKILGILAGILEQPRATELPAVLELCFNEMRSRVSEIRVERAGFAAFYAGDVS